MLFVSVIIPNYNHSLYLRKRIDSVLAQTWTNFEVIVLDDCSTDDSRDIIESYRHESKVSHIVYNEVNTKSTFKQWKKGLDLAKGDWIWIAESDDCCEPTLLAELVQPLQTHNNISVAFCQSVVVDTADKIIYTTSATSLAEVMDGKQFVCKHMLGGNRINNASTAIFRKNCFAAVPTDYLSMTYCGDWFFWVNICLQGDVFICGKFLNYYLRHPNNVSTGAIRDGRHFLEGNRIYDFVSKQMPLHPDDVEAAIQIKTDAYMEMRHQFKNEEVRSNVLESLQALSPSVKPLLNRKMHNANPGRLRHVLKNVQNFFTPVF